MIKKVLIANRGEIAVRVVRACREMGITSVAVYSDADRYALHVKKADQAVNLGPETVEGYLNVHRLVNLAVATGCHAIHPGYGFLSENPALAAACQQRGLRFIGPDAEVIRRMGDKTEARRAMQEAGVPVIPGTNDNLESVEQALTLADELGYPVMLKATSGGGGRGIRRVDSAEELGRQYERVLSEAKKAFGSAEIFMEKAIVDPRHLEVQILADKHGQVVHLFERDCSIQRRHQKLIEIAPSPQINDELRARLGSYAVRAAKSVGYTNAGTVEFLLAQDGQVYFMEMNTRLQVEHTVSEQITGVDIVKEQIRIAEGQPLRYFQPDIQMRGYAMQFRINAEDPQKDFQPSFGRITRYYAPGGPGVRTDGAIYTGYEIPPYYDSLCVKLTVWGLTWEQLLYRSHRALEDIGVYGIKTTIPYFREILRHRSMRAGSFDTSFVEANPQLLEYTPERPPEQLAAALAAAIAAHMGL